MAAIVWKVRELAEKRGITSPSQLADRVEIAHNTALALWRGTPLQAHLPTLVKVCIKLDANVSDLLEFAPEENLIAEAYELAA